MFIKFILNKPYKHIIRGETKMNLINYLSNVAIPFVILIFVFYSFKSKNMVFDDFIDGAKEAIDITIGLVPTLVGLFIAIGALRASGIIDIIINIVTPLLNILHFPSEIMPLAILRPISRKCINCSSYRYYEKLWS